MKIDQLSDQLLADLDAATDDALATAITWAEVRALDVELFAVGETRARRVRWTLIVIARRGERTARWWEIPVRREGAVAMNILFCSDLLRVVNRERIAATQGRPFNAMTSAGTT